MKFLVSISWSTSPCVVYRIFESMTLLNHFVKQTLDDEDNTVSITITKRV